MNSTNHRIKQFNIEKNIFVARKYNNVSSDESIQISQLFKSYDMRDMRFKKKIIALMCIISSAINGQTLIRDYSDYRNYKIPYDTSYFLFNNKTNSLNENRGLIGHHLTFLSPSIFSLFRFVNSNKSYLKKQEIENLKYNSFKIVDFVKVGQISCFAILNENDTIFYDFNYTPSQCFINEGFERFKERHINTIYYSVNECEIIEINNELYNLKWGEKFAIKNIELGKLSEYDFGLVISLKGMRDEIVVPLSFNDYAFPKGNNLIELINIDSKKLNTTFKIKATLVNENKYNSILLDKTRMVKIGLTQKEVQKLLGTTPDRLKVDGFDEVWVYKYSGFSFLVFFNNFRCVNIY